MIKLNGMSPKDFFASVTLRKEKVKLGIDGEIEADFGSGVVSMGQIYGEEEYDEDGDRIDTTSEDLSYIENSYNSQIGVDGSGDQIEIRPLPAATPKQLVKNISTLIGHVLYDARKSTVKGDTFPLGCHIHFGLSAAGKRYMRYPADKRVVRALDILLGAPLQFCNGSVRTDRGYGELGDVRTQNHGVEYRTCPSSILAFPSILAIVLKIGKATMQYMRIWDSYWSDEQGDALSKEVTAIRGGYYHAHHQKDSSHFLERDNYWMLSDSEFTRFRNFILGWKSKFSEVGLRAAWLNNARLPRLTFKNKKAKAMVVFTRDSFSAEFVDFINNRVKGFSFETPDGNDIVVHIGGLASTRGSGLVSVPFTEDVVPHACLRSAGIGVLSGDMRVRFSVGTTVGISPEFRDATAVVKYRKELLAIARYVKSCMIYMADARNRL